MKRILIVSLALLISAPAISDGGNSLYALIAADANQVTFQKQRVRQWRGADPVIVAMVDRAADRSGLPRYVMHDHVKKESGYRPNARNPKSTAKGLLQVLHGSHEAIVGRRMSRAEHFRLMADPDYALRVGAAHMKACAELMPGASSHALWRRCHVAGHGAVGGSIRQAAAHYSADTSGWLQRGTVALPWGSS